MSHSWTLAKRLAAAFGIFVVLTALISALAVLSLGTLRSLTERMAHEAQELTHSVQLEALAEREVADARGYLLTRSDTLLRDLREAEAASDALLARQVEHATTPEAKRLLAEIVTADHELAEGIERFIAAHQADSETKEFAGYLQRLGDELEKEELPRVERLRKAIEAYRATEQQRLDAERADFNRTITQTSRWVMGGAGVTLLLAVILGVVFTRNLTRQIADAVQNVQSSSAELQASATQQAAASKEQAAATNETTTTIKELVATARQIADGAQRVATIAEQTATAARSGDQTARRAQEALGDIRRQVDAIVSHMLEMGKRSQQIGGVLEIINELAEQTNILAINATIEAAGAGDSGKRFAVVADEIRKLADRVGTSSKDIRVLVDEVRTAVNITVMATEQGSKAVDAGARQVGDVATAFSQIAGMVGTTTEAAREIELSTRQQTTAVEQVNIAMADVTQAAKETEATASQTFQTAAQLATLSKDLTRMIKSDARAS